MVAALALVLMAGTGRFVFQPLLRGPDADMLLHYVSLCFIWPCLVKRGGIGSWAGGLGGGGTVVQISVRTSPTQTVAGAGACVVARQLLLSFHERKKSVCVLLLLSPCLWDWPCTMLAKRARVPKIVLGFHNWLTGGSKRQACCY